MGWLLLIAAVLVLCFGFVLLYGAPYLPTLKPQVELALDKLDMQPGETLLELGCGDGRVLLAAARRGYRCVGYELNPLLAALAWLRTRRYGNKVRVVWGDYWRASWPSASGIFAFILPRYMTKLDNKITREATKPVRLVSFAFAIPGKQEVGAIEQGVHVYEYR